MGQESCLKAWRGGAWGSGLHQVVLEMHVLVWATLHASTAAADNTTDVTHMRTRTHTHKKQNRAACSRTQRFLGPKALTSVLIIQPGYE